MDDDISFGEFKQSQPETGLAPDRNPHFSVAWVGEPSQPPDIFIDLDVMGELEAHALDNVDMELGGVLLGDQRIDEHGRPFVVIRDSLRAEHYEATRGSFKFTHKTWESISRQREQFPGQIAIVGWYHTHPGWGIFLSEMDRFICNHFFNHSLDLALVIDPVRDERGWFVWEQTAKSPETKRLPGFALFAHRRREIELCTVADRYNEREPMSTDPRTRLSRSNAPPANMTLLERPAPTAAWYAIGALVFVQCILAAAILMRSPSAATSQPPPDSLATQVELLVRERQAQTKADVYRDLLRSTIEKTPDSVGFVDRLDALNEQVGVLSASFDGQSALTRELKDQLAASNGQLARLTTDNKRLSESLAQAETLAKALQTKIDTSAASNTTSGISIWILIIYGGLIGIVAAAGGVLGGFSWARRRWTFGDDDPDGDADRVAGSEDGSQMRSA